MKMRSFTRLPQSLGKGRAADLMRLWRAKARASASRFPSRESTPTTVIATSICAERSRSFSRLLKKTRMLRCAQSISLQRTRRVRLCSSIFARLASEIFLNNLQTKSKEYSKGENKMKNKIVRFIGGSVLAAVAVTGCGWMSSQGPMESHSMHGSMMDNKESDTSAAELRVGLNSM